MCDDAKATATGTAKKGIRFRLVKQQLFTCIILFWTFLCRHYRTTTWKCLISRFVEDVNTRKRLFSFFLRSIQSLRLQLQKTFFQHFMTWTRWNKRDKVWSRANSLLGCRFRSRRRRCRLSFFSLPTACRLFSRGVIFTRARVSHALLSLRKNGGLLVVYLFVALRRLLYFPCCSS